MFAWHRSLDLPNFCAFEAALRDDWRPVLLEVFKVRHSVRAREGSTLRHMHPRPRRLSRLALQEYVELTPDSDAVTMMFDAPTWRASRDHMRSVGRSGTDADVAEVNAASVRVMQELRVQVEKERGTSFLIGGQVRSAPVS